MSYSFQPDDSSRQKSGEQLSPQGASSGDHEFYDNPSIAIIILGEKLHH